MGIFSAILDKLRGHGRQQEGASATRAPTAEPTSTATASQQSSATAQQSAASTLKDVDVEAVLLNMSQQRGGGGNYQSSIVDLLKLLELDSSLKARTELAEELGVHAGAHGSAEQNIALHKAVMRKLAENGGKVPESMKS